LNEESVRFALVHDLNANYRLDHLHTISTTAYFTGHSRWDTTNQPIFIDKVLILRVRTIQHVPVLDQLWLDVDHWDAKVLAIQSQTTLHEIDIYIFGWTGDELSMFSVSVDEEQ
jgi:hypothetical protein